MSIWTEIQNLYANFHNWFFPKFSWIGSIKDWFIEDLGTNNLLFLVKLVSPIIVLALVYGTHIRLKGGRFIPSFNLAAKCVLSLYFFLPLIWIGVDAIREEARGDIGFIAFFSVFIIIGLVGVLKVYSLLVDHSSDSDDSNDELKRERR